MSQPCTNLSQTAGIRQAEFSNRIGFAREVSEISAFVARVTLADLAPWRLHFEAQLRIVEWTVEIQRFEDGVSLLPKWRNRQTRWTQNPVSVKDVWVQVPPLVLRRCFKKGSGTFKVDRVLKLLFHM